MFNFIRTHNCSQLRQEHINQIVTLSGWVHRNRDHGGLIFIDLRDRFGLTQLVFDPEKDAELHAQAERLRSEWVISIKGHVKARGDGMANPNLATGDIEVSVYQMEVLSKAKTPPFSIADKFIDVNEELRLKYRYLDMRRGDILKNLVLRHQLLRTTHNYLAAEKFIEVQTPLLARSTPEGARDFLVPSRTNPGNFYALPQSPQLFKQLMMIGGLDRYYQIGICLRDEDLRANRQPEFTQIDLEMSFATPKQLFSLIENLVHSIFRECIDKEVQIPFKEISHSTCLERYGTDKPDTRFGMELHRLNDIAQRSTFEVFLEQLHRGNTIKGLCVKGGQDISRKNIDGYTQFIGRLGIKGLAWMKYQQSKLVSNIVKFFTEDLQQELITRLDVEEGDLIFLVADTEECVNKALDHLRRKLAQDRNLVSPDRYEFLWITDFPLFNWNEELGRLESEHHPFTSPMFDDLHLLDTDSLKIRSSSYDLVCNGHEVASGSQRIHDPELQEKIFSILNLSEEEIDEKFGFFVEALKYGTPPHLGIALGLDRLVMILSHTDNIRDVIAFPKTQKGSDLMMGCPSSVMKSQLNDLKLSVQDDELSWRH